MLRTRESAKAATPTSVESFERRFGRALPKAYRAFLLTANGGRPERDLVTVPGCIGSPYARIHFFFGIGHPIESYDLAWNVAHASDLPPGLVPIATTEGADMFCLATSGSVVFWDGYDNAVFPIAESFEGFLGQLYRDDLSPSFINDGSSDSSS
jgi:hypothetical protein